MTVEPYLPLPLWVSLALAAAALLCHYAVTGRRLLARGRWTAIVTLMSIAVAIPLVVLLNPVRVRPMPPPAGKPLLTILVDRSASMATADVADADAPTKKIRYVEACNVARKMFEELGPRYEVQVVGFAEQTATTSVESIVKNSPNGAATDLAGALDDVLVDRPQGQAVLVLGDGVHNAEGGTNRLRQSVERAKAMNVSVFTQAIGGDSGVDDLDVTLNMPQELAFVGQRTPVAVRLRQRGSAASRTKLSLWLDGKRVEERDEQLSPDATVGSVFQVSQAKAGLYRYEVRAEPIGKEATVVNNTATLLVRVVDQPIRVLLLEGKPYWDTKFLIRTLSLDKSIELVSLVRMAEGRYLCRTVTHEKASSENNLPKPADGEKKDGVKNVDSQDDDARWLDRWEILENADQQLGKPETLGGFQIIVLGRDADAFLSDDVLSRLKKWLVEGEGSLVCFRGPPSSEINQRLGELMPVRWSPSRESRFRVEMSEAGKALRWLSVGENDLSLSELPSLAAVARPERPKPLAVVLATSSGDKKEAATPVITYQPVGNGRVVVLEGAGMWRWAFLPAQYERHDESYGILWRSMIRWLVSSSGLLPSQQFALRTDKVIFSQSETVSANLLAAAERSGESPQVALFEGKSEKPRLFSAAPVGDRPGQFRVVFGRLAEGVYRAKVVGCDDASASTAFDVRGNLSERLDVAVRPDVLRWIAQQTDGTAFDRADPAKLAKQFENHIEKSRPQQNRRVGMWDRWWVLLGSLGLWGFAWSLRRASGLI